MPAALQFLIRTRAALARRPRALVAALVALAIVVVFGLGVLVGHHAAAVKGSAARAFELAKRNDELQNKLAILQRDRQVSQIADRVLQKNLADRDEEIRSLRADQAFYSRLVGADAQPGGLTVHGIVLKPIARSRAFNFIVTLTHSAEGGKEIDGDLSLAVEGIHGDQLMVLDWKQLAGANAGKGLPFAFKYFQQVQGTLMLPPGFIPNRIRVTLDPESGQSVTRSWPWSDAVHDSAVGGMP
ncbi:MAG TPA: DUF6776 family protein [Rhodanobacteraceae bacterium]|nr:DUF6776 family protein [Rhodanobacteraceae bacterium]